jgi:hypothetical protein
VMKKRITKISLLIFIISSITWLGAINIRAIIGNEILEWSTLSFRPGLNPEFEREIFRLINYSSIVVIPGYFLTFISAIIFISTTTLTFKENGWLLMSALLFFVFSPVEFYTSFLDGKMLWLELFTHPPLGEFETLFIRRLGALAGVPVIALCCYYSIIGLAIWQPLKKARAVPEPQKITL